LRLNSAAGTPASCSRKIAMICSSVNLDRFIRPSLSIDLLPENWTVQS
jgi:hypothetical protein